MTRAATVRLLSLLCVGVAGTSAVQASAESHEEFVCTSGAARKIVRIYNHPQPKTVHGAKVVCRVDYTKDGKTRTLWSSNSDHAYCTTKALALVTKLIQDKYKCKPELVDVNR